MGTASLGGGERAGRLGGIVALAARLGGRVARRVRLRAVAGRAAAWPALGSVALVGAGPGSADLVTLRGARRLGEADVVFYDRLVDPDLLALAPAGAERVYVGKAPGSAAWPQERINGLLVAAALAGKRVVRLKCGDPGIFARGAEEAAALDAAGVPWEVVPGVTAASAAAAAAGGFLTERGRTDTLVLATGRLRPGDPAPDWGRLAQPGTTVALYMGVAGAPDIQAALLAAGAPDSSPVEVVARAGAPDMQVVRARLADFVEAMRAAEIANPAIILVRVEKVVEAAGRKVSRQAA